MADFCVRRVSRTTSSACSRPTPGPRSAATSTPLRWWDPCGPDGTPTAQVGRTTIDRPNSHGDTDALPDRAQGRRERTRRQLGAGCGHAGEPVIRGLRDGRRGEFGDLPSRRGTLVHYAIEAMAHL